MEIYKTENNSVLETFTILLVSNAIFQITTDDCGTEKGCFMFPSSCSNDCDFLVTYNVTSSNKIEFELSGKGDWVAVGFSDDQFMVIIQLIVPEASLSEKKASIGMEILISNLEAPLPLFTGQVNLDDYRTRVCDIYRSFSFKTIKFNFQNVT